MCKEEKLNTKNKNIKGGDPRNTLLKLNFNFDNLAITVTWGKDWGGVGGFYWH